MAHRFIFMTLVFTVYGQLVVKWRVSVAGALPAETAGKVLFFLRLLSDPWVLSAFAAAFLGGLSWMTAMTHFELSYAYPFMSLAFVAVLIFSVLFLGEPITSAKIIGTTLVMAGLVVLAR